MDKLMHSRTSRFLTASIVLSPFIGTYGLFVRVITIGDLFLMLSILFALIESARKRKLIVSTSFLPYLLYVIVHFILTLALRTVDDPYDFIGSTLRYLMILIVCVFFAKQYFDVEYGAKLYRYMCIISTVFLIIQTICVIFFGFYPKGVIKVSFLPVMREELYTFGDSLPMGQFFRFRPRSLFGEPAAYSVYNVGYLALSLFWKKERNLRVQLLLSLGLLLSMSSTGILMCVAVWGMYLLTVVRGRFNGVQMVLLVVGVVVVCTVTVKSAFFQYFWYRFTSTSSTEDRFRAYGTFGYYFDSKPIYALFGYGVGGIQQATYAAGFAKLVICFGIVGTGFFVLSSILVFVRGNTLQRKIFFVFLTFQLGTEFLFGGLLMCFLPYVFTTQAQFEEQAVPREGAYMPLVEG